VAVIIGAAFGKIIDSLVKDIFMPLIGLVLPGGGYQNWVIQVGDATVPYGKFLGEVVSFIVVALALFLFVVKFLGWVTRLRKEEAAESLPPLTKEQELLTEIRDLLKRNGQPVHPGNLPAVPEGKVP